MSGYYKGGVYYSEDEDYEIFEDDLPVAPSPYGRTKTPQTVTNRYRTRGNNRSYERRPYNDEPVYTLLAIPYVVSDDIVIPIYTPYYMSDRNYKNQWRSQAEWKASGITIPNYQYVSYMGKTYPVGSAEETELREIAEAAPRQILDLVERAENYQSGGSRTEYVDRVIVRAPKGWMMINVVFFIVIIVLLLMAMNGAMFV